MPAHQSAPNAHPGPDREPGEVVLGASSSLPVALALVTSYALTCTVLIVCTAHFAAGALGFVLPYEKVRDLLTAGMAISAGVVGEPVLDRTRRALLKRRH